MSANRHGGLLPGAHSVAQVNLIPPYVAIKRKVATARNWFGLVVLLVLLSVSLAGVWVKWLDQQAKAELVSVQDQNAALLAAQADYAEVPTVLNELKARGEARQLAMTSEVLWDPYLGAISAVTPVGASLENLSVAQATVWLPAQVQVAGPLSTGNIVGQVSISGKALTLDDVSDWEDGLAALPGVANVEMTTMEVSDNNGVVFYTVSGTFGLTVEAFSNQYRQEQ